MKYTLCLFAAAVIVSGICTGCKKDNSETPAAIEKAAAAKEWAPEMAKPAHDPNDGGDHSGHNH